MKAFKTLYCILVFIFHTMTFASTDEVVLGVLAKRGTEICFLKWNATADYLNKSIPDHHFTIKPLKFDQIELFVENQDIDFLLANPAIYVQHEYNHGAQRIATMMNLHGDNISTKFGGIIFAHADRNDLQTIQNLKNKTFLAVDETSFGGWMTAWRELKTQHIDPYLHFKSLTFAGTHDSVVYAVRDGLIDAGAVRTEIIERMSKEGKIDIDDFHIFPSSSIKEMKLPFQISTPLYPEWPIAKLPHVPDDLSKDVTAALLKLTMDHPAALTAQIAGWTVPLNYQPVHDCLRTLEITPYENINQISIQQLFKQYWIVLLITFSLLIFLIYLSLRLSQNNLKLKRVKGAMEEELYLRKETEAALVEAKEKAELIFQVVPSAIFTVNTDCEITSLNQRALEILGYKKDEILGKKCNLFAMSPCSDLCGLFKGKHKGTIRSKECTIQNKDGNILFINKNAQLLYDNSGTVIGGIESFEDITEHRATEQRIQQSEVRYRELFHKMSSGVAVYETVNDGEDFSIKSMNEAGLKMDHIQLKDIVGKSIKEIFPGVIEFGLFDVLKRVWQTGEPEELPMAFYSDRRIEAARENHVYKLPSGEVVAIYDDMTEKVIAQKEIEENRERFELAVKGSSDGIWDWDLNTNELYMSPQWKAQIGYQDHELENKFENFENNLHPDDHSRVFQTFQKYLNRELDEYNIEFRFKHKDGSYRWILARGVALWDDKKKPYRMSGSHTDITQRKEAEAELQSSQKFLDELIHGVHEGIGIVDKNEVITYCNAAYASIFDTTPEQMTGKNLINFLNDEARKIVSRQTDKRKKGEITIYEIPLITQKGNEKYIRVSASPRYDETGRYIGAFGAILDISTRKDVERDLQNSKIRYQNAERITHLGSWQMNIQTGETNWSEEFFRICGYKPGSIEPSTETGMQIIHPDDRERAGKALEEAIKTGKPYSIEKRIVRPNGNIRWVHSQGEIFYDKKNQPWKLIGSFLDITDRKEAEEVIKQNTARLKKAQNVAHLGSYEWDLLNDQIHWSDEMYTIHGIKKKNKNRNFEEYVEAFIHYEDQEKFRLHFERISLKRKTSSLEYRIIKPDNSMRWVENEFSLEKNKNGELIKIIGTVHDITDRIEAFNTITEAKEAAEVANRTKSEFLANMSHEIRTPLNAILGFTEILKTKLDEEKYKEYLKSIDASGKTLLTLINDILDLSKIEAGKLDLQYQPTNAYDIFKEIERIFSWKIKEKGLEFALQIDGTIPKALLLDETRLRQILLNLVGNAVKFTHEGYIKLSAFRKASSKDTSNIDLIISIEDTGIGIREDQQKSIFDAFHQQAGQNNAQYGGTGLGLAITRRLVEMMDGEISLESATNAGSTFTVILKNIPVSSVSESQQVQTEVIPIAMEFEPATVLVVDDIPQNRVLVREYLDEFRLNVLEASNGLESIEMARKDKPDLILMDIKMPIMDGVEATKILKSETATQKIPVVALTASAMKEDRDRIIQLGCNGYIQKPVSKQELLTELQKHLDGTVTEISSEMKKDTDSEIKREKDILYDNTRKKDIEMMLARLKGEYYKDWEIIQKTFIMGKIQTFAEIILNDEIASQIHIISDWAKQIIYLVEHFDIEKLPAVLEQYPSLVNKIESVISKTANA